MSTDDPTLSFITPRVAAGVLFTDDQDRVLMVVPSYKDYLDIPGGYVEDGETPRAAAKREVFEELGIDPHIGRLLVADWREDSPEANGGAKLLLIFDGGRLDAKQIAALVVDGSEILDVRFLGLTELESATIERLRVRVCEAMAARLQAGSSYLENGRAYADQDL